MGGLVIDAENLHFWTMRHHLPTGSGPDSVDGVKAVFWKTDYQA